MSEAEFGDFFRGLAERLLGVTLAPEHGISAAVLAASEARLGSVIPASLRAFYAVAGRFSPFVRAHNTLLAPHELHVDGSYVVFMEENQSVVSWGFQLSEMDSEDPVAWQRNNTPPVAWYSEEKSFSELMLDMFEWYEKRGIWE